MTDPPRPPSIQPVSGNAHGSNAITVNSSTHHVPPLVNGMSVDEEEGAIKCVCGHPEDDGNTVACDKCNTWQHQACYYQDRPVPSDSEPHFCIDCEPGQVINVQRAKQLQALRWVTSNVEEVRTKKPPKSHKKKLKTGESSTMWPDKNEMGSPRNGQVKEPAKKKQHKHSNSIHTGSSTAPKLVARRSASHSVQSPSKSDAIEVTGEPYSEEFMHLYDDDPGESIMKANLFNNLPVTRELNTLSNDVDELFRVTGGKSPRDVFYQAHSIETAPQPQLRKVSDEDDSRDFHGRHPKWIKLVCESELHPNSFVGELRGKIGLKKDYVSDESNRWNELRHPLPFVFFHPDLPIYIDTRNEGSLVRYVRRSCTGNVVLRTFLEGSDYRFGFVAAREIRAGEELTLSWTPDEHVRGFLQHIDTTNGSNTEQPFDETGRTYIANYYSKVFANFGGCACAPDAPRCLRLITHRPVILANGKKKPGRKPRERPNTSRSGSEAIRYKEEEEEEEEEDTSADSKPHSRDMTPQDSKPAIIGLELSEREKRKIAALERADQDKNQPVPKKKKRTSGPIAATQSLKDSSTSKSRQGDTGTGRKSSGSPVNKTFPMPSLLRKESSSAGSPPSRTHRIQPTYVEASMQTDPDPEFDHVQQELRNPTPVRKFVSLKRRLLMKHQQARVGVEEQQNSAPPIPHEPSPAEHELVSKKDIDGDVLMEDDPPTNDSPLSSKSSPVEKFRPPDAPIIQQPELPHVEPLQPPPRPTTTANGFRNPDLRIPLPSNEMSNGTPPTPTNMAQSPISQSPASLLTPSAVSLPSPSPVKKKLSLANYMKMRRASHLGQPDTPTSSAATKDKEGEIVASPTSSAPSVDVPAVESGPPGEKSDHEKTESSEAVPITQPVPAINNPDAMDIDSKS